jgi:hypothetical protein
MEYILELQFNVLMDGTNFNMLLQVKHGDQRVQVAM